MSNTESNTDEGEVQNKFTVNVSDRSNFWYPLLTNHDPYDNLSVFTARKVFHQKSFKKRASFDGR